MSYSAVKINRQNGVDLPVIKKILYSYTVSMEGGLCSVVTKSMPHSAPLFSATRKATCACAHGFIRELRHYNHHFSKRDANRWIELNQPEFVDKHQTTAKTGYGCYAAWGVFANADA